MNKKLLMLLGAATLTLTGCNNNNNSEDSKKEDETPTEVVDDSLAIKFNGNGLAFANGLPEKAKEGDTVSFMVSALSGYEITEVKVTTTDDEEVELSGSVNKGFSFKMPAGEVNVTATALGAYFHVDMLDKDKVVFTYQKASETSRKVKDFIAGYYIADGEKPQSGDYVYARAGQEVAILFNYCASANNIKVTVNGEEARKENYIIYNEVEEGAEEGTEPTVKYEYTAYKFTMPNTNAAIDVTADEKPLKVVTSQDEKYTTFVYRLVDGAKVEASEFYAGETAYVDIEINEEFKNNYSLKSCQYSYYTRSGYDTKVSEKPSTSEVKSVEDGTYSYKISTYTGYASDISLNFDTLEKKYAGKDFVGTWVGKEFYGDRANNLPTATLTTMKIEDTGNVSIGTTKISIDDTKVDENNKTLGTKTSSGSAERTIRYDGEIAWASYYSYDKSEETDIYVFIKNVSNWDNVTITKNTDANMYSKYMLFAEFTDSTTSDLIGNILKVDGVIYLNVTLKNGDTAYKPTDVTLNSSFDIYKGDTKVASHNMESA